MNKNITITEFKEILQHNNNASDLHRGILIFNGIISELVATPHLSNFYGISYCTAGSCIVKKDLETYTFSTGHLFVLRPGEVYQVEAVEDFEAIHVLFHQSFVLRNLMLNQHNIASLPFFRTDFPNLINLKKSDKNNVAAYIKKIDNQNHREGVFSNQILESILTTFIYEICNIISFTTANNENEISVGKEIFERFTILLAENHTTSKSVKFYANKLNISATYLNEIIKRKTTKNALTVINEYIIFKVKISLKHTNYNISEIAEIFNFSDATTFIRFFRKQTLITPLKFRNSLSNVEMPV